MVGCKSEAQPAGSRWVNSVAEASAAEMGTDVS